MRPAYSKEGRTEPPKTPRTPKVPVTSGFGVFGDFGGFSSSFLSKAGFNNYLKAARIRVGALVNFGARKLEFRRFVLDPDPSVSSACSVVPPSVPG